MDAVYFERLNAFFDKHHFAINHLLNIEAKIAYILHSFGVENLFQEIENEIDRCQTRSGKNEKRALHYLNLAKKLQFAGKKQRGQCELYYKQALLNMSLDIKQDHFEESASFIYFAIAQMFAESSDKYLPALKSVNQAIELAGDKKYWVDYLPMLAMLKIELQIKLKQYNEALQTLRLLQESMTDSSGDGHANGRQVIDHYERNLRRLEAKSVVEILPLDDRHNGLLEWDENCYIESSPTKGRYMRTSGSIPIGTYLAKERAVSVVFKSQFATHKCAFCYDTIQDIFYPCRNCTQVVFCSGKCEQQSHERGAHRYECKLTDLFTECHAAQHAFRIIAAFGLSNAVRFYRNIESERKLTIPQHLQEQRLSSQPFELLDSKSQWRVLTLINSFVDHLPEEDAESHIETELLWWALKVVLVINQQQHYFDNIKTNCRLLNDFFLLVKSVAILMRKLQFNVFGWLEMDPSDMNTNYLIGNCVCLVSTFINHSCNPTAYWEIENGVIVLSAARFLDPGFEISISYGPHTFINFHKRQRRLADYRFLCGCPICMQDIQKLLCLGCTHCDGPVYPPEEDIQMAKCLVCGHLYNDYWVVMNQAIQARLQLLFHCRFGDTNLNSNVHALSCEWPNVGQLARKLSDCLYSQCEPLQQCVSAACDFLVQKQMLYEALQVVTNYLAKINLEQSWQGGDTLKGIILITKWRQLEARVMKREIQLGRVWKDFQKSAKRNQTLNSIIELMEISTDYVE